MSSLNKSQLRTENNSSFPNNNSQFITPELLRDFNADIIDSMVANQDSGSFLAGSTGSLLATASFDNGTRLMTFTKGDASTFDVSIPDATVNTGSLLVTASVVDATTTYTKGNGDVFTTTINNVANAVSASHAVNADTATSSSHAVNADSAISSSYVTGQENFARTNVNNSFTGNQTFNDITVNGTGSFAYIQQVTGSAKIIGDAFLILNNDTPTERYAGIKVIDSGSTQDTASLQWDGDAHDWFYEFSSSAAHEYGVVLMGPEYTTLGTPTYNTNNTITKGTGGHHIVDSNITDDGSTITLGSTTDVSGPLSASNLESIEITNLESTASVDRTRIDDLANATGSYAVTNATNTFTEKQIVSGSDGFVNQNFAAPGTNQEKALFNVSGAEINSTPYNRVFFGIADYPSSGDQYKDYFAIEYYNSLSYTYGSEFSINGLSSRLLTRANGGAGSARAQVETKDNNDGTTTLGLRGNQIRIGADSGNNTSLVIGNGNMSTAMTGTNNFFGRTVISSSLELRTDPVTISSNTASLDFSAASMFELTLVSGSDTHIVPTNVAQGQTVNVLVEQPGTGTGSVSFAPEIFQPTGSLYTPTARSGTRDILTMICFNNTSQIFVSNVVELENTI